MTERRVTTEAVIPAVTETNVIDRHTTTAEPRDRIRWGPIVAGLVSAIAAMLVLSVLGLAIGLSALKDRADGSDIASSAAIWSAVSALISFFIGGWVAGRTSAVRKGELGLLNGLMVGAAALTLLLYLTGSGVGNLVGGLGSNIGDIARLGTEQVQSGQVNTTNAQNQAQDAAQQARDAARKSYDTAKKSAWGTLAGLVLALAASGAGGVLGHTAKGDRENAADGPTEAPATRRPAM